MDSDAVIAVLRHADGREEHALARAADRTVGAPVHVEDGTTWLIAETTEAVMDTPDGVVPVAQLVCVRPELP